jgi:hypothetical protein
LSGEIEAEWRDATTVTITSADVLRCNRLRGLSVATCSCRTGPDTPDNHAGWQECPPSARGRLTPNFIEACRALLPVQLATAWVPSCDSRVAPTLSGSRGKPAERRLPQYTGDACSNCGSVEMVRSGSCATCQVCGETGGCS